MAHSTIVGGSTADRLLNCPGSYQAIMALPASADKPSEYALEGTAMHAVMQRLMRDRAAAERGERLLIDVYQQAQDYLGDIFEDRALTQEHLDTMVFPALEHLGKLEQEYGDGFFVLDVERSVDFPGIPGAHGTCDLILGSKTHVLHIDWKFGQGLPVKALYVDPAGNIVNAQLLFYTAASMNSAKGFYIKKKELVIAIIQPRTDTPLSHTIVTRKEIKWFIEDLHNAVAVATDRSPPLRRGEHCRWCPAKIACPLWTAPMLQLAERFDEVVPRTAAVSGVVDEYGEYLAKAKMLVDMATQFKTELDKQLHAYLEDGGVVPGWRLKLKAKQRQWVDADIVYHELEALGFDEDDIWQSPKLQTFARTDAAAKRLGVEIPAHLRVAPTTSETTICQTDDPAPVVHKPLAIEQFRAALAEIKKTA